MRALIGVDGSPGSYAAVELAGRILAADKDEIVLYYSPPAATLHLLEDSSGVLSEVQLFLSDAVFNKGKELLPDLFRSKVQTVASTRRPEHGILLTASDRMVDLIVIGARGLGPLMQPTLGSVASHVVDHSAVPVLLVRGIVPDPGAPLRVLLASDGSALSHCASELLMRFSWPANTTGIALTVIEPETQHKLPQWLTEQLDEAQLAALGMGQFPASEQEQTFVQRGMEHWFGHLPKMFQSGSPIVVSGHAAEQILHAIDSNHIDIAVLGAHRLGPIQKMFLGSTSAHVVRQASCSVLIVRERK